MASAGVVSWVVSWVVSRVVSGVVSGVVSRVVSGVVSRMVSRVVSGFMAWGMESRVSGMKVWVFTKSRKTGVLFKMTNCLGNLDLFVMRDLHIMVFADFFVFFMTFFVRLVLADLLMWVFVFMANLKHKKDWHINSLILPSKKTQKNYISML